MRILVTQECLQEHLEAWIDFLEKTNEGIGICNEQITDLNANHLAAVVMISYSENTVEKLQNESDHT